MILLLAAGIADANAVEEKPTRSQTEVSNDVVKPKTQRCLPTRNVGIAETSKEYYSSCLHRLDDEKPPIEAK